MIRWLLYLGLMVLLMALITSPTEKEWKAYVNIAVDTNSCKPVIHYNSYKLAYFSLFSLTSVSSCNEDQLNNSASLAVNLHKKQRYIGMFGKFWKL